VSIKTLGISSSCVWLPCTNDTPAEAERYLDLPFLPEVADPGLEIERKFVLRERPPWLDEHLSVEIEQGYLAIVEGETEVRLRRKDSQTLLTVKRGIGEVRGEQEVELHEDQFAALWPLTEGRRVTKRRYQVPHDDLTIEVDVFEGGLRGMLLGEVEFDSEAASKTFDAPAWLGDEVTGDVRYTNESLALRGAPQEGAG
jgi:adenylate cyclase